MKIKCKGLCQFLAQTFMAQSLSETFPTLVFKKLKAYPNVGKSLYNRLRSTPIPESIYLQLTLFQLIYRC